jgi:hypothetical protein
MEQDLAVVLAEQEQRLRSNTRRIEGLERGQEALNRLATAVEVLATKQESTARSVERMGREVSELESRPGKRWESLLDKVLLVLAGAFVSFLLTRGGA